jgi:hypothetical protein
MYVLSLLSSRVFFIFFPSFLQLKDFQLDHAKRLTRQLDPSFTPQIDMWKGEILL